MLFGPRCGRVCGITVPHSDALEFCLPHRLYAWQSPIHCARDALGIQRIHPLRHHMQNANRQALSTLGAGLLTVKTPLQIAASKGHTDVVAALLEAAAVVETCMDEIGHVSEGRVKLLV